MSCRGIAMARPGLTPFAAACAAVVLFASASIGLAQEKVGVSSAVNPDATGTPPGGAARKLVIGQDVVFNERIATQAEGQTQLLFVDESSMTVGPNSDLTIDQFVYDPKSGGGKLAMSATKGLLRFVGGKLSKQDEGVTLRTNSATLAIRGGAFIANIGGDGRLTAIFIYGRGLTVTGVNGVSQTIQRPGFEVTVDGRGAAPSAPKPTPPGELDQLLTQLDGRSGGTGGTSNIPTDQTVASSGVGQTISGNFNASVQQATAQAQIGTPTGLNPATTQTSITPQSATSLSLNCALQATCTAQSTQVATTTSGQPVGGANSVVLNPTPTPTPPPTPTPTVTLTYAGRFKNTNGNGTGRGFVAQGGTADIAYSGGTLSFPSGQPQNGVFSASTAAGSISFPLAPGSSTFGPQGTSSSFGSFTGTSFLSADNSFFYASLIPTNAPTERAFIFGGMPVNPAFYQPTGQNRPLAFNIQPDAALQSGIPFVRNQAGGSVPNASVSQLYVLAPAFTAFGDATTGTAARALQGSLAISGQGANQQSVVAVATGTVNALQSNGQPILNGQLRGSSLLSAFSPPTRIQSAVSSTVDGAGNSFYGGNSITAFVLDQTAYNSGGTGVTTSPVIPSTAAELSPTGATTAYGFAQPVLAGTPPSGLGATRTTQTLTGNFGGLMQTTAQPQPYVLTGGVSVATDATTNRIQANFNGTANPSSGPVALALQYGGLSGPDAGGQAFVDDARFAAAESPTSPSGVKAYFINANVAPPPTSLLPSGASYCQCQYLQWGYWGGDVPLTSPGSTTPRIDRAHINFWAAGPATPLSDVATLQGQSFTGTYTGHAIGSVSNNGANYVAAGGFNGTYNFGTRAANFTISNFDGNTFTAAGTVPLNGASYTLSGTAPRTGMAGTINGTFYGPMAAETGGNFTLQSTLGVPYMASGIFAGKR
jgi:trimeric autotransporter adhesin